MGKTKTLKNKIRLYEATLSKIITVFKKRQTWYERFF